MIYRVAEIRRDVRIALDQNMRSGQLEGLEDVETLSLDALIDSKIEEAAQRVELEAPAHLLEEGHTFGGDAPYWGDRGSGWVMLPRDFMRLIAFRMSDWERSAYRAITPGDPMYEKQSSRYKGIRGNPQRPVVAIVNRAVGKALEFYSCKSEEAYIARASYVPYPEIDGDGGIDICERCYRAVVYMTASLVLSAYGDREQGAAMAELANTIME